VGGGVPVQTTEPPAAIIVRQGKVLDFIDGVTQRDETPEEYVRQEIAKSVVREYGYPRDDIKVEFTLRLGTRRPRADLVIFTNGEPHRQESADIIVECKSPKIKGDDRKEGVGQLHSYMSACPNVRYGMWTNGSERYCYRRTIGKSEPWDEIPDVPAFGQTGRSGTSTLRAAQAGFE
jgi:type I restriction enzyme M protein